MTKKYICMREQRKLMLKMLKFVDEICRKNNIKYSLFGGSLIGAIRHKGYIPWDDDIDIILTKDNYDKLIKILDQETGRYQTLKFGEGGERFGFIKLVDTKTQLVELDHSYRSDKYGIFVDIFCFVPIPNDLNNRKRQYRQLKLFRSLYIRNKLSFKGNTVKELIHVFGRNIISRVIGYQMINKLFSKILNRYIDENTDYVLDNWPTYGFEKDIQLKKNIEEYIDAKFEGLNVMIFKNYDEILRTTYGNYMELPPKSERVPKHNMKMWWREDDDK